MTFKILRFDALKDDHPHFQVYRHEPKPQDTVLETLKEIRDQQDPSLAFRYSCREAVCGSCSMVINGRIALACRTQVRDLKAEEVVIEPLPNLEIQKDLAESWENPDALTWVFRLKKGVTFHNGEELTAGDVKFSLERQFLHFPSTISARGFESAASFLDRHNILESAPRFSEAGCGN